jgi:putative oxidoreductase
MKRFRLVAVWILQSLLAAFFAVQAVVKLGGSQAWITRFRAWGYPDHFYLVVGLAELSGAILMLIPRLAKLGVLLLIAVMLGAAATHLIHHEPQVATTLVLTALLVLILYLRRGADSRASQAS